MLTAALAGGETQFPTGRVTFRARHAVTDHKKGTRFVDLAEGSVVWDGDRARWEMRQTDREEGPGFGGFADPVPLAEEPPVPDSLPLRVRIRTADREIESWPADRWAFVRPLMEARLPEVALARPGDSWLGLPGGGSGRASFARRLEQLKFHPGDGGNVPDCEVKLTGDRMEVTAAVSRSFEEWPNIMTLHAVLDEVPRVTLHRIETHTGGFLEEYASEWHENPNGGPRTIRTLARYKDFRLGVRETHFDVLFKSFDPAPTIAADAFAFASLKLPPGSRVKRLDAAGRTVRETRVPGRATAPDRFEKLSEELAAGTFAGGEGNE